MIFNQPKSSSNSSRMSCRKGNSWNRLHTFTPNKNKLHPNSYIQKPELELLSQPLSKKNIIPNYFPCTYLIPAQNQAIKLTNTSLAKEQDFMTINELLLLEEELFDQKRHYKPLPKETPKTTKALPFNIQLKGMRINVGYMKTSEGKRSRQMSNRNFVREVKNPISMGRRAYSVNRNNMKKKRHDTPTPWDNDKQVDTVESAKKVGYMRF